MIVKIKQETENQKIFIGELPTNEGVDIYVRANNFRPTIGKSYSGYPLHMWETMYDDIVLVTVDLFDRETLDDIT
jgi:hypothetical protein